MGDVWEMRGSALQARAASSELLLQVQSLHLSCQDCFASCAICEEGTHSTCITDNVSSVTAHAFNLRFK